MVPVIIYILGIIPGYFAFKDYLKETLGNYTIGMRYTAFIVALFSWVNVMCWLIFVLPLKNDKPASW